MSNTGFSRLTSASSTGDIAVARVRREQIKHAVQQILSSEHRIASESQVLDFIRHALHRRINLNDLWVAERGNRLLWSILPMANAGRTILLLSPGYTPDAAQAQAAEQLLTAICRNYAAHGTHLAQALVDHTAHTLAGVFSACGFSRLAELHYLQKSLYGSVEAPALPPGFTMHTYSEQTHRRFADVIEASYQGSLDCPALNGVRNMEDVIAGHKASGDFDPRLWTLLCGPDGPLAVLLLSVSAQVDAMELVYLGLVPAARRQGWGKVMMQQALASASRKRLGRLTLAVDAQNVPALRLYYRCGMQRYCTKLALMRDLRAIHMQSTSPVIPCITR